MKTFVPFLLALFFLASCHSSRHTSAAEITNENRNYHSDSLILQNAHNQWAFFHSDLTAHLDSPVIMIHRRDSSTLFIAARNLRFNHATKVKTHAADTLSVSRHATIDSTAIDIKHQKSVNSYDSQYPSGAKYLTALIMLSILALLARKFLNR